jgi:hypothetical protein
MLEEYLETAYEEYRKRSGLKSKAADRRQRKRLAQSDSDQERDQEDEPAPVAEGGPESDSDSEQEEEGGSNPLVMGLSQGPRPSKEQLAQQWFSQSVFEDVRNGKEQGGGGGNQAKRGRPERAEPASSESEEEEGAGRRNKRRKGMANGVLGNGTVAGSGAGLGPSTSGAGAESGGGEEGGFEEVAAAASESSSSEDDGELDGYDTDDKAETLAYARAMLRCATLASDGCSV